ncbi:LacI family DNA-binding transcriptional regulator [Neptunicoccus sediminis]|uniref:LacI family DNA-binding transcriptional regulator n=1 Tax=Neptunicoccus sediminis TaxID=1892596 RepID=UPI000845D4B2|nr:LacI family DNA-binding transcriptional regulator [Neptunicoccus sediminis]
MPNDKITSLDVAKRAGVSQSAVSRVFTKGASASQKTIDKVRKAAKELGYRPNVLARSLITGRSRIVGLVVAYLDNYFYPVALQKLSNALKEEGYHVMVFMASDTTKDIERVVDEMLDYQVDAIVAASVPLSSDLAGRCRDEGIPLVFFNRSQAGENLTSVTADNYAGGKEIARFLAAHHPERIGYIAGFEGASTQRDREAGFLDGLNAAGREVSSRTVGNFNTQETRAAALAMFSTPRHPDAVFVANDHMAFTVMDVLRSELHLTVPGDVILVGYDDVPPAVWAGYSLTTVRQRTGRMVEETVKVLMNAIATGEAPVANIKIAGPLIVRGSAPAPKGWAG